MRRFRLSDNECWATEFEADEATFEQELVSAMERNSGRVVSLHVLRSEAMSDSSTWWNVGQVLMGVHYDSRNPERHHPGHWEIRGNGLRFLCISPEFPCASAVWAVAHHQPHPTLPTIDCRPGQAPEQQDLQSLFTGLVSAARNQRRQITYRSPNLPPHRAEREEGDRNSYMRDLGLRYRQAAEEFRPDTDWSAWRDYVLNTVQPGEIADLVIAAVVG